MEKIANKKNGIDVDQLLGTINAVKSDPEVADFRFKAKTEWLEGGHCRTTFLPFYGAKEEDSSRTNP
ncbi:MAG: OsmC family peroxiredoxin, partial [Salegentibacter sp.]|nr:OsmC family peroxiredoxin [Salegentibacter sp.]